MLRFLALPFTLIYAAIVGIRNKMFDLGILKSVKFNFPVICVGNITVGGTGKTPHVEYLVKLLKDEFNLGIISRGYKRESKGFIYANQDSTVKDIGDEPKQMKLKFPDIQLAVDANRVRAINGLKHFDPEIKVFLLDDAYQHRYVRPGMSILLVDYNRPIFDDHIMPWGRLRESARQVLRANIIIVTKCPENMKPLDYRIFTMNIKPKPYQEIFFTNFTYGGLAPVFPDLAQPVDYNIIVNKFYSVLLVTGIANPKHLLNFLKKYCEDIEHLSFPDHYNYKLNDIKRIHQKFDTLENSFKIIITTEKDAARIRENSHISDEAKKFYFYIPVEVKFLLNQQEKFNKEILDYARTNKTHLGIS